jgi:hypothetical protein
MWQVRNKKKHGKIKTKNKIKKALRGNKIYNIKNCLLRALKRKNETKKEICGRPETKKEKHGKIKNKIKKALHGNKIYNIKN